MIIKFWLLHKRIHYYCYKAWFIKRMRFKSNASTRA